MVITKHGKIIAANDINRLYLIEECAKIIREAAGCFHDKTLSRQDTLHIMRERAETIIKFVDENLAIPDIED